MVHVLVTSDVLDEIFLGGTLSTVHVTKLVNIEVKMIITHSSHIFLKALYVVTLYSVASRARK